MKNAIEIDGLKKSYGPHVVLNGLEFCVRRGEIFLPCWVSMAREKPQRWRVLRA